MDFLNGQKGSKYRDTTQIEARLKEGKTFDECITIIQNKMADEFFQRNPKHLNPTTLFRKSHWDKYLNDGQGASMSKADQLRFKNATASQRWLDESK